MGDFARSLTNSNIFFGTQSDCMKKKTIWTKSNLDIIHCRSSLTRCVTIHNNIKHFLSPSWTNLVTNALATVVQTLDSAIHRINHYPANKYKRNQLHYSVDSFICFSENWALGKRLIFDIFEFESRERRRQREKDRVSLGIQHLYSHFTWLHRLHMH